MILLQCIGNRDGRENMTACTTTCDDDADTPWPPEGGVSILLLFLNLFPFKLGLIAPPSADSPTVGMGTSGGALPSICSTFLATLKIIPMAPQVNRNELPPMLTSGSVTPVTGTRFTFTAILATACITNVKLNPNARNAPNA
jgi:hypothetical protein